MNRSKALIPCLLVLTLAAATALQAKTLHVKAKKTASQDTICFSIQPSVAPRQEQPTPAADSLIASTVVPAGVIGTPILTDIDPSVTLSKGGKGGKGGGVLYFKCDSEAAGGPSCSCMGSDDCLRLGVSGACVKGTIKCNDQDSTCTCQWNV